MWIMWKLLCTIILMGRYALAAPSNQEHETDNLLINALRIIKDCGDRSMILCLKERALHYLDTDTTGDITLTDGIALIKTEDDADASMGRSLKSLTLPEEPEARENEVDSLLVDRVARFFSTHTLQFKMPKDSIQDIQRTLEEARGKKKKAKKYLLPLLLLFKLKMAALLPLAIGSIALLSFKALIVAKIALLLASIIALKKLVEPKKENFEVVAHAHDEHNYKRSMNDDVDGNRDAHNLAYRSYSKHN